MKKPMVKNVIRRVAESFGYDVLSTARTGVQFWRDMDRVKPTRGFRTILDIGAHHGESTLHFASRAPDARVYSFEPASNSFQRLVQATRSLPNVTCVQRAVGDAPCSMTLHLDDWSQANTLLSRDAEYAPRSQSSALRSENVMVTTIDQFVAEHAITHVDLLKTDTEGFDAHVLRGARATLGRGAVDFIYAEVSFEPNDQQHTKFTELVAETTAAGFHLLGFYEVSHAQQPWRIAYCNALFTRL